MGQQTIKPGVKTSEFYLALLNNLVGIAVVLGYLTPQQADDFVKAVVSLIGAAMVIISTGLYIWARLKLKSNGANSGTQNMKAPSATDPSHFGISDGSGKLIPR